MTTAAIVAGTVWIYILRAFTKVTMDSLCLIGLLC